MNKSMVSIIMPCYNAGKYIKMSVQSVINQTYSNWELIIVDDCSSDNSLEILKYYIVLDDRIKYFKTTNPSGSPTLPRNIAIEKAKGRYIAFLDSDDLWEPNKLESQVELFKIDKVALVFSNYEKINEKGISNNRRIKAPLIVDYKKLLKGNVIACCTCIYDSHKVGKKLFYKQGHEDYALWLEILRHGFIAINTGYFSAKYRVRDESVSSNKFRSITWVYNIYRKNENLSILDSLFFTSITLSKSFFKYLK